MLPYIGVTGFMKRSEVESAIETFESLSGMDSRMLMIGILVCNSTLAGEQAGRYKNRYPNISAISDLLIQHPRIVNLIHYGTSQKETLKAHLEQMIALGGESLGGFQLSIRWPDPNAIRVIKSGRVVLQLGAGALKEANHDPNVVAQRLDAYADVVTDILVDMSGGGGVLVDPDSVRGYLQEIQRRHPTIGLGIAGGLFSKRLDRWKDLVKEFPNVSIDAEGRLRTLEDHMDLVEMQDYLLATPQLFG